MIAVESAAAVARISREAFMARDARRKPDTPLMLNLLWTSALLIFLYVMSYPIVLRLGQSGKTSNSPGYQPVEWLIDETPLGLSIWQWSKIWGTDEELIQRATFRKIEARTRPMVYDDVSSNSGRAR